MFTTFIQGKTTCIPLEQAHMKETHKIKKKCIKEIRIRTGLICLNGIFDTYLRVSINNQFVGIVSYEVSSKNNGCQ